MKKATLCGQAKRCTDAALRQAVHRELSDPRVVQFTRREETATEDRRENPPGVRSLWRTAPVTLSCLLCSDRGSRRRAAQARIY